MELDRNSNSALGLLCVLAGEVEFISKLLQGIGLLCLGKKGIQVRVPAVCCVRVYARAWMGSCVRVYACIGSCVCVCASRVHVLAVALAQLVGLNSLCFCLYLFAALCSPGTIAESHARIAHHHTHTHTYIHTHTHIIKSHTYIYTHTHIYTHIHIHS
jgi:hypothetical protein